MATIEERRDKFKSVILGIIKETKSRYKDDYECGNHDPFALIEAWARQAKQEFGLDAHQGSHSILNDELVSRMLHATLRDFGGAIHTDWRHHGALKDRLPPQPYVLLPEWEPENLLKGIEFTLRRRDLVRMIRIRLAEVELEGLKVNLDWSGLLEPWRGTAEREFITRITIKGWDERQSSGLTVINVETEQEYSSLDKELKAFIAAIVQNDGADVASIVSNKHSDGELRHKHQFDEHWKPETILKRAKAYNRSRSSSPSSRSHVALSLSRFSARARQPC